MKQRTSKRYVGIAVFVVLLLMVGGLYWQHQRISDWFRLRDYQPTAAVTEIADQTKMTDAARHLFYINRPELESKTAFRQNCPEYESTIVLGCYHHGQRGIHVLQVDDPRLEGIEQVTAAHEMLHAGYERLSSRDRLQVDGWLQEYAVRGLNDPRVKETIEDYDRTEPGERSNEMHSIFATEMVELPDQLETYYARYFQDRSAVAGFAARYQQAFTSRQSQVADYDVRLNEQNKTIKANTQRLKQNREDLLAYEQELLALQEREDVTRYNAGVSTYNQMVAAYNELLEQTKALIEDHNQSVVKRNNLAAQTIELKQAIDSSSLPASQ